jgi:uncharacterized membrane protein
MNQTENTVQTPRAGGAPAPVVLPVTRNDILEVLAAGLRDFRSAPLHGLAISGIYTAGGWMLILLLVRFDLPYLVYPLAAGFALIAPFIATAFYAVSRSLERNEPVSWGEIGRSVRGATKRDLGWMALVTGFSLFIWIFAVYLDGYRGAAVFRLSGVEIL